MQLFYSKSITDVAQFFDIEGQENIHLIKALRKSIGEFIFVTNGKGQLFEAEIISIKKKKSSLKTIKILKEGINLNKLTIAIAPTKNISRIEWFIEKSVELGIREFFLFTSQNSERLNVNSERLQLKSVSAMKQSLKYHLPNVSELVKFKKILENNDDYETKLIASCEENQLNFIENLPNCNNTIILIGPEGGFSKEEVNLAKQFGFISVSLGENRLRTETAGMFVCSVFNAFKR